MNTVDLKQDNIFIKLNINHIDVSEKNYFIYTNENGINYLKKIIDHSVFNDLLSPVDIFDRFLNKIANDFYTVLPNNAGENMYSGINNNNNKWKTKAMYVRVEHKDEMEIFNNTFKDIVNKLEQLVGEGNLNVVQLSRETYKKHDKNESDLLKCLETTRLNQILENDLNHKENNNKSHKI